MSNNPIITDIVVLINRGHRFLIDNLTDILMSKSQNSMLLQNINFVCSISTVIPCRIKESRTFIGRGVLQRNFVCKLSPFLPPPSFPSSVLCGQTTGDKLRLRKFWLRVPAGSVSRPLVSISSL